MSGLVRVLLYLCAVVVSSSCLPGSASASPELSGNTRFKFGPGNATVTFGADAIINANDAGSTGTIKVQLWALAAPYRSGAGGLRGHLLGGFTLEPLFAGNVYNRVSQTVPASLPPQAGTYVLALVVSEYRGRQYVISDFRNFSTPVSLQPPQLFSMRGPWSMQTDLDNNLLELDVALISHTRTSKTGSLRLAVWATRRPYRGGAIRGHELGHVDLRALRKGLVYNDLLQSTELTVPPPGDYYISLLLLEFDGEDYVIQAHLPADDTISFY